MFHLVKMTFVERFQVDVITSDSLEDERFCQQNLHKKIGINV